MFHLIQLLLKLLLQVEGDLPDNSRLVGSILIGGAWLILVAELFPDPLGVWRDWFLWVGWFAVGLALFLLLRRQVWKCQGGAPKRNRSLFQK